MRILFACNSYTWGGAESYVLTLAGALSQREHSVYVAAPNGSEVVHASRTMSGLTVLPMNIGPKLSRRSALEMALHFPLHRATFRRYLRQWREHYGIEIVHLQFKKEQIIASSMAAQMGAAVVWTEHGRLPRPLSRFWPARSLYRHVSRYAHRIICVAEFVKDNMISHGLSEDTLCVCYNGIDHWPSSDNSTTGLRTQFGLAPDDLVIASASRLTREKGIEYLLEAAGAILQKAPRAHFVILGDGPQRHPLEERAQRLGISERVVFTGHRRDVPAVLETIDVFVCPSIQEGFPFSVLEAMRAGKPVVASRTGGVPELLRHGVDGLLVNVGDIPGLAAAISQLLQDRELRSRLGETGRTRVVRKFTTSAMIDCTEAVFIDALSAARSA